MTTENDIHINFGGTATRKVDELLGHYGESHRHPVNEVIHFVAIPLIMLSLVGLMYALHPWVAYAFIGASMVYYARLSVVAVFGHDGAGQFAGVLVDWPNGRQGVANLAGDFHWRLDRAVHWPLSKQSYRFLKTFNTCGWGRCLCCPNCLWNWASSGSWKFFIDKLASSRRTHCLECY